MGRCSRGFAFEVALDEAAEKLGLDPNRGAPAHLHGEFVRP